MTELKVDDAPASSPKPIARVGEIVAGKFKVERILGEGGMGIVVAARHMQLDERVALKFLRPQALKNPETVARFAQEARAAVKLKSEHVARVLDVGIRDDGSPFIVMEYLQGQDLAQLLEKSGPQPVQAAVELIIQACEGLAEAHARGIIHRDIKPENLFLVEHGHGWRILKILDFGISKAALTGTVLTDSSSSNIRTQSIMGSPCYMSPEQLRSTQSVDHRADIWSLGAVLFELLTGRTAYDHEKPLTELVATILEQPAPRLRSLLPSAPPELEMVVAKCLQRDRNLRYQNAAELAIALLPFAPKRARVAVERATTLTKAAGLSDERLVVPGSIAPPPIGAALDVRASFGPLTSPRVSRVSTPDPQGPAAFGKYRLIASLGRGGMADVFLALARGPLGFNKLVVIKKLRQGLADEGSFRQMFTDEARLAARLNHPNVVQTYEVGEYAGAYFIAMEYLEGQPLNVLIREAKRAAFRLDPLFSARIVADALAGLHYAHELRDYDGKPLQIIHRDVSPHNVFVTYEGQVKLVDFGIAKAALSSQQTEVGVLKGKVAYMAPEQATGDNIDRRADIFSMGIVLWELLADRRLMPAESAPVVIHRLVTAPIPRVVDLVGDVEPELGEIAARALQKDPSQRFQTAKEMRDALEAYLSHRDQAPREDAVGVQVQAMFAEARDRMLHQIQACVESAATGEEPREIISLASDARRSDDLGPESLGGGSSRQRRIDEMEARISSGPFAITNDTPPLGIRVDRSEVNEPSAITVLTPRRRALAWVGLVVLLALAVGLGALLVRSQGPVVAGPAASASGGVTTASASTAATAPSAAASAAGSASGGTSEVGSARAPGGGQVHHGTTPPAAPKPTAHPNPQPDLDIRMQR